MKMTYRRYVIVNFIDFVFFLQLIMNKRNFFFKYIFVEVMELDVFKVENKKSRLFFFRMLHEFLKKSVFVTRYYTRNSYGFYCHKKKSLEY